MKETKTCYFRISKESADKIQKIAAAKRVSFNAAVQDIFDEFFETVEKGNSLSMVERVSDLSKTVGELEDRLERMSFLLLAFGSTLMQDETRFINTIYAGINSHNKYETFQRFFNEKLK